MKRGPKLRGVASLALGACFWAATLLPEVARADTPPTLWDRAKDPAVHERWDLHVTVRELMAVQATEGFAALEKASIQRARDLLEHAHAEQSPDVRLRFDLGEIYQSLEMNDETIRVLTPALKMAPDHPAATEAWIALAYAHAKRGHQREERDTYREFLARETNDRSRTSALLNAAEAEMHLGNLAESVAEYREAIRVASSIPYDPDVHKTVILAVWGLAVALDRAGDPAASAEQTQRAMRWDIDEQIIAHDPQVFFVPDYERSWYLGLSALIHGAEARNPRIAAMYFARAESEWSNYVNSALSSDRWLPLARAHLDRAHAARIAAEKRPLPKPPVGRPELDASGVP